MSLPQTLSTNFTLAEFIRSDRAIAAHMDNTPPAMVVFNAQQLCTNVLEPLRAHFNKPVRILSGYRSPALNRMLGGVADSQHVTGEAADITINGVSNMDVAMWLRDNGAVKFDQLIAETLHENDGAAGWIHVSWAGARNRNEPLSFMGKAKGYIGGLSYAA